MIAVAARSWRLRSWGAARIFSVQRFVHVNPLSQVLYRCSSNYSPCTPGILSGDAYAVLGVERNCSPSELRQRYTDLLMNLHPDTAAHTHDLSVGDTAAHEPHVEAVSEHTKAASGMAAAAMGR